MRAMTERYQARVAVYLLLFRGTSVLLSRRFQTGFADGLYGLPSGHVEKGEMATEAIIRETAEEVGLTIHPNDVQCVHVMHRQSKDADYMDVVFLLRAWKGEPINAEPEKCDDLRWFSVDDLPANTLPSVKQMITCVRQGILYSEWRH